MLKSNLDTPEAEIIPSLFFFVDLQQQLDY